MSETSQLGEYAEQIGDLEDKNERLRRLVMTAHLEGYKQCYKGLGLKDEDFIPPVVAEYWVESDTLVELREIEGRSGGHGTVDPRG